MGTKVKVASWVVQIVVAAILAQTLYFKFTGAEESVHIFTALGVEPWGRLGTGLLELAAVVLLLTPRVVVVGALLTVALMLGAIGAHLTKLGIVVQDDGGLLFALAVFNLLGVLLVTFLRRRELPVIGSHPE
jgi:hypothetical protein